MKQEPILPMIAAGDEEAMSELIDRYGRVIRWMARQNGVKDVEDAAQDIFITLWQNAGKYDPAKGAESTFVGTIARRKLIDRHRKRNRRPATQEMDEVPQQALQVLPSIEASTDLALASRAMQSLRPVQRSVLRLSLLEGLSHSEIAGELELPLGTVKTHIRRGLNDLRNTIGARPLDSAIAA